MGARLGKQNFCDYFAAFGLRAATGIDLPGEIKRSEYYTADRMGPVELASCSFGQSSKVSYLQMITAVCAVVNGGKLMQPHVVQSIHDTERNTVQQVEPTVKAQVIRPETSAVMRELMEGVVTTGTGKNGAVAGYRVGGKTGTSQKLDSENERARIASFVAVAPIENPKIAVLICLDEPHSWTTSGGALSGPVAAEVLQKSLPRLGIQPTLGLATAAVMITMIYLFSHWQAKGRVYIAVIHYVGTEAGDDIVRALGRIKYAVKSKTMRGENTEMAVEVFCKDPNMEFADRIRAV